MTKRSADGGRSKVIDSARYFFTKKGFHQTAMAELSERADVSIGQIYRLFSNKSEIIAAIAGDDFTARIERLADLRDETSAGRLDAREAVYRVVLDALDGEDALTFEILAEASRSDYIREIIGGLCVRYRLVISAIISNAHPDLAGSKLEAAEEVLVSMLFGLGNRTFLRPSLSTAETASLATDMILAMFTY